MAKQKRLKEITTEYADVDITKQCVLSTGETVQPGAKIRVGAGDAYRLLANGACELLGEVKDEAPAEKESDSKEASTSEDAGDAKEGADSAGDGDDEGSE